MVGGIQCCIVLSKYILHKYFRRLTKTSPFNSHARRGRGFPLAMHFNLTDPPGEILWSGLTEMKYGCRRSLGGRGRAVDTNPTAVPAVDTIQDFLIELDLSFFSVENQWNLSE